MRDLLENSCSARIAVVAVAGCCVLALVQAAAAHNDLDMREIFRPPVARPAPEASSPPEAHAVVPASRPARVAAHRTQRQSPRVVAERRAPAQHVAARAAVPLNIHLAVLPPSRGELFEPPAQNPAIVSIYQDQTLRRGDAVMMRDGLHVFRGQQTGLHQPADFVRLAHAPDLDWHMRKTLSAFEDNPPDRWRS